jgi:hypothetical protein
MEDRRRSEDSRIDVLTSEFKSFIERYDKDEERAESWRGKFCSKMDDMRRDMASLPCSKGHDIHVDRQLGAIWWIVSVCLVGVLSVAMAWGAISNQVITNTQRWDRYLQEQANGEHGGL